MTNYILSIILGASPLTSIKKGWSRLCSVRLIADAPLSVEIDDLELWNRTTEELIESYRSIGGRAMWAKQPSRALAIVGYALRKRPRTDEMQNVFESYQELELKLEVDGPERTYVDGE